MEIALSEREKKCLELRKTMTLKEIGALFGVTRERVHQIEKRALRKSKGIK